MKLIVNFAPTGMIPTKEMTPFAAVSVSEIVEQIHEALEIGITMVHLHARYPQTGVPTYHSTVYRDIIENVRKYSKELIICVSLSGRNFKEFEKRSEPLQLDGDAKPDMGSLTLSSLNFIQNASMNSPDMVKALAREMLKRGIVPELEAFDCGMINFANYLEKKGLIKPPHYFNLLLGNIAGAQANLLHAGIMVNDLPANSYWSFAGIGVTQLQMNMFAIAAGGGVRIGLEDNIFFDTSRKQLTSNTDLLRRIHRIANEAGRELMLPGELRDYLRLKPGVNGEYGRDAVDFDE